jgi:hypothetical protein
MPDLFHRMFAVLYSIFEDEKTLRVCRITKSANSDAKTPSTLQDYATHPVHEE